ncbi:hypothetical protein HY387_00615 [Candidatus Daviesbacteria bacterium]|nr:hypothetical protein [Candidatus Daviesbacteria bacterium]
MLKLTKVLSTKTFVISQTLILFLFLILLGGLHYIVNIQYQKPTKYSLLGPVTTKPVSFTLEVQNPDDSSLVFQKNILISGKTNPKLPVLLSSQFNDQVIESREDGTFSSEFSLKEGVNEIKIAVFNATGEERSLQRTVYYSKEKI